MPLLGYDANSEFGLICDDIKRDYGLFCETGIGVYMGGVRGSLAYLARNFPEKLKEEFGDSIKKIIEDPKSAERGHIDSFVQSLN